MTKLTILAVIVAAVSGLVYVVAFNPQPDQQAVEQELRRLLPEQVRETAAIVPRVDDYGTHTEIAFDRSKFPGMEARGLVRLVVDIDDPGLLPSCESFKSEYLNENNYLGSLKECAAVSMLGFLGPPSMPGRRTMIDQ